MAKLTDTQMTILLKALAREDCAAVLPVGTKLATVRRAGAILVARKLMRESRSKPGLPIWREESDGRNVSMIVTRAGRDAIGADTPAKGVAPAIEAASSAATVKFERKKAGARDGRFRKEISTSGDSPGASNSEGPAAIPAPRAGSKQAMVIGMLSKAPGATLDALVRATGWLPHTTRAALTGLRKRGFVLERNHNGNGKSTYRINGEPDRVVA